MNEPKKPRKGNRTDSANQAPDQQPEAAPIEQEKPIVNAIDANVEAAPAEGAVEGTEGTEGNVPAEGTDANVPAEGAGTEGAPEGESVEQAVEAVLNPLQANAVQVLEWVKAGAEGEMPFSPDAMDLIIGWAKTPVPTRAGRTPASTTHDDTCASLVQHEESREDRLTRERTAFEATPFAAIDAAWLAIKAGIDAVYDCNCTLSKRTASGRQAPTRTGKAGAVVTGPDGTQYAMDSLNLAARKALELYPNAKQCAAYVKRTNKVSDGGDGKTANARVFIASDLKAGRLPEGSVTFNDDAVEPEAAPADETPTTETPAEGTPATA